MTTLYRPVLIESAEQAEALPKGAVVFDGAPEDGDTYVRVGGDWHTNGYPGVLSEALALGFTVTALVPIEAEKEAQGITTWPRPDNAPWPKHSDLCGNSDGGYYYREDDGTVHDITEETTAWLDAHPVRARLVTPWESV